MMRWNGFRGTLVFGAVAAAALLAFVPLAAPVLGPRGALRCFAVGIGALYLFGLGGSWRRGFVAAGAAGGLGLVLLALPLGVTATTLGSAIGIALCRSGILYRSRPLRACSVEVLLGLGGLGLAGFLAGSGLASLALAVWGYFLVQSVFFLVGGIGARREPAPGDPFDRAAAGIEALLR